MSWRLWGGWRPGLPALVNSRPMKHTVYVRHRDAGRIRGLSPDTVRRSGLFPPV